MTPEFGDPGTFKGVEGDDVWNTANGLDTTSSGEINNNYYPLYNLESRRSTAYLRSLVKLIPIPSAASSQLLRVNTHTAFSR